MGINQITERGVKAERGDLVFFLVHPDNLSVLSREEVQGRVSTLAGLLRAMPGLRMLTLDFEVNTGRPGPAALAVRPEGQESQFCTSARCGKIQR